MTEEREALLSLAGSVGVSLTLIPLLSLEEDLSLTLHSNVFLKELLPLNLNNNVLNSILIQKK